MKVLISDKLDEKALSLFEEKNITFDYKPEITPEELLTSIPFYEGLIVRSRTKVTKEIIEQGKNLKVIGRAGSGVDNIDMLTIQEKHISVVNTPNANAQAAAEHTIGLMLSLLRSYPQAFSSMREGQWLKKELKGSELSGKTVGIIGYGHIGKKGEQLLKAFGCQISVFSKSYKTIAIEDLFRSSDIITIHLTLTDETRGMVTGRLLALMKKTAYFVNTSRGEIVDENALYQIISSGKIAGVALDVFHTEPLPADSKWRKEKNVILTPHIGASTSEALVRATKTVIEDVLRVLQGEEPKNQVI